MAPRARKKPVAKPCTCPALIKSQKLKLARERKQLDLSKKKFVLQMAEYTAGGPKLLMKLRRLESENLQLKEGNKVLDREAFFIRADVEEMHRREDVLNMQIDALVTELKDFVDVSITGQQPTSTGKHPIGGKRQTTKIAVPPRIKIEDGRVDLFRLFGLKKPADSTLLQQQVTGKAAAIQSEEHGSGAAPSDSATPKDPPMGVPETSPGKLVLEPSTSHSSRIRNTVAILNNIKGKKRDSEASNNASPGPATQPSRATIKSLTSTPNVKSFPAKPRIQPSPSKTMTAKSSGVKKTIFKKTPTNAPKTKEKTAVSKISASGREEAAAKPPQAQVKSVFADGTTAPTRSSRRQQEKKSG